MMNKYGIGVIGVAALCFSLGLNLANVYLGELNQDEGWYLNAAREVADGRLPYRDFVYTQGPVLPLTYSLTTPCIERYGLLAGRLYTSGLGWMSAFLAAWLAARCVRPGWKRAVAVTVFSFLACNVYQSYFTSVVKTYSLCVFFIMAGLLALSFVSSSRRYVAPCLAGVFLALAAGTRLSSGIALPVCGLFLLAQVRGLGHTPWLMFGAGGGVTLLLLFIPFLVMDPDSFFYGLVHYHSERSVGGWKESLLFKAGSISRVVQAYFTACAALVLLILLRLFRKRHRPPCQEEGLPGFLAVLWVMAGAMFLVHLSAPFPYDDYQVVVYPVFCTALGVVLIRFMADRFPEDILDPHPPAMAAWPAAAALLVSMGAALSSPVNQSWFIEGQDRIWPKTKPQADLAELRAAGAWLRERTEAGDHLLTQDIYLAVEAGLKVVPGLELGPFSYYPELNDAEAERHHVLNRAGLLALIESTDAEYAAFSGYGLAIQCPEVTPLPEKERETLFVEIEKRYERVHTVPGFGQAHTTLNIYRLRSASEKPSGPDPGS
jgi:hypothetical protein